MNLISSNQAEIDIKKFKKIKRISKGGFGVVYKVEEKETGELFAAKIIDCDDDEEMCNQMIKREISIMMYARHPTIIKFIGYSKLDFHEENNITIIMELAKNGSLKNVIKKIQEGDGPKDYTNTSRQIILVGVARGMKYLHDRSIIHRDLKTDNILLDEDFRPHISDFGLSKFIEAGHTRSQTKFGGTLQYEAPEILQGLKYDQKVDVYSFAILMFEVLTDSVPFPELEKEDFNTFNFISKLINENYRPKFTVPVKKSFTNLIERCWSKNPEERPDFGEIFTMLSNKNNNHEDEDLFLDDVDVNEFNLYVEDITKVTDSTEKLLSIISQKEEEIKKLKDIIKSQNDAIESFINDKNKCENDNKEGENDNKEGENDKKEGENDKKEDENDKKEDENDKKEDENDNKAEKTDKKEGEISTKVVEELETTIDEFNSLLIQSQQKVTSKMMNNGDKFFMRVNELLLYLIKFSPNDRDKLIRLDKNSQNDIHLSESHKICLMSDSIDMLNKGIKFKPILSSEFYEILSHFDAITFELNYPSNYFDLSYHSVNEVKKKLGNKIEISVVIGSKKKIIGTEFKLDTEINRISISSSVTSIGCYAFDGCSSLTQISFETPSSLTSIKDCAFYYCSSLTQISVPSSVTLIGKGAFIGCKSLTQVTIPSSVSVLERIFVECCKLNVITIQKNNDNSLLDYLDNKLFVIRSTKNKDKYDLLFVRLDIEKLDIPSNINRLGSSSLRDCSLLKEITIPSTVKEIGEDVFHGCSSLKEIKIHSSITSILDRLFRKCSSLTNIIIPPSVTTIGSCAFEYCSSLTKIIIPSSVTKIRSYAFSKCSSLTQISIPSSVTVIEEGILSGCSSLKEISFPSSITQITDYTFDECSSLQKISIPFSVKQIGMYAFVGCSSLEQISIPSSVTKINSSAFVRCSSLKQVTIPSSLASFKFDPQVNVVV